MSVPYALLSKNVINDLVDDADNDPSNEYNTGFTFNGTDLEITDGGSVQTVDLSVLDNTNLQAELDTTQTGAGLATDGTYSANTTANYIAGATALNDADDKLDAQAKVNADAISANNTQISANTTAISTNATDIATNVTAIALNTAKDTNVSTDLTITGTTGARVIVSSDGTDATIPVATSVVSGVMSKATYDEHLVNTAKTGITTDQATAISTNTSNIATNVTDILTNASGITTNATDIATNVTDIATNATDIATNVTAIALNTAKDTNVSTDLTITGTTGARVIVSSDGTDATIPVATSVVSGVMSKATYDEHLVNTAKTGITTDQATAISTNTSNIATNVTDILTNASGITTNATDIATNVTDIATNATDIATNVTAIALNTAKDTNVSTDLTITGTTGARVIVSSDGTDATIPVATSVVSGVMSKATYDEHLVNTAKTGITTDQATAISTNATDIATNATDIATNVTDIATNVTAIALNTAKDTNVSTDLTITGTTGARVIVSSDGTDATIPVATAVVSGVMSKATYDEHLVNTAKTGITTDQATAISTNTSNIATNATDIATNVTDIAGNTTAISTNATDIATNVTAIALNTAKDTNVSTDLTITGTTGARVIVSSDGTDATIPVATAVVSGVMSKATYDEHLVNTAKTGITTDQATAISTNTSNIATNATDIATNVTDIATNATDIATNVTDIATNATDIATNVTAIALNTAKDTNVSTDLTITGTTGARVIVSSDGTDATIPVATAVVSGVMSKATYDEHLVNTAKTGITTDQATAISTNAS